MKHTIKSFTSMFAFSILMTACVGDNERVEFPQTCAEAGTKDGEQTLYVDHDEAKPWTAFCADKKEYLPVDAGQNFSSYIAGGLSAGTDVETHYGKIRIDPITLSVDGRDQRFTLSSGKLMHLGNVEVKSMPLGVAMTCDLNGFAFSQVSLIDTPFVMDTKFALGGDTNTRRGVADFWQDNDVVEITSAGECGWTAPADAPANPVNAAGGSIQLTYKK